MGIVMRSSSGIPSDKLFVYDELKHKGNQNEILTSVGCRLLKKATISKFEMYVILNAYPMIIPSYKLKDVVIGEIWSIGHAKLFDSLDNIKTPMIRNVFEVDDGKEKHWCWVYYMPDVNFNPDAPSVKKNKEGKWKV